MGIDSNSLMNLGGLDNTGAALIKAISDAVGWALKPTQIRRVGKAEMDMDYERAIKKMEIEDEQWRRGILRHLYEERIKQANIESITAQALPQLSDSARPEEVETDWFSQFFDRCRLVSDEEMQRLWATVLAGEANAPGSYSKGTLAVLADLEKEDAQSFMKLCRFSVGVEDGAGECEFFPLIYDFQDEFYTSRDINFPILIHFVDLGLISFEYKGSYTISNIEKEGLLTYSGHTVLVGLMGRSDVGFSVGHVRLTRAGEQLASLLSQEAHDGFLEYLVRHWEAIGYSVQLLS